MEKQIMYDQIEPERIRMTGNRNSKGNAVTTFRLKYKMKNNEMIDFKIQLPQMIAPFGISNNALFAKDKNPTKWFLQLSFKNEENDPKLQMFRKKMKEVEERIQYLFYKNFSEEMVPVDEDIKDDDKRDELQRLPKRYFNPIIKKGNTKNNITYPDIFKVGISWDDKKDMPIDRVEFYNMREEKQPYTKIKQGAKITAIISFNAVYMRAMKKFIPNIKLVQLQYKNRENFTGFQIKTDGLSDDEESGSGGDDKNKDIYDSESSESVAFQDEEEGESEEGKGDFSMEDKTEADEEEA